MPYTIEEIGQALASEREAQGLTQRSFAQKAGTTQARISKIETGDTDPRISTLIELARNLDLELTLIPRRHIPAVKGLIAENRLDSGEKAVRSLLDRLINTLIQLNILYPDKEQLDLLLRSARNLQNFRLSAELNSPLTKILENVRLVQETPTLMSTLNESAQALRRLRNEYAHRSGSENAYPRAAYTLADEDDDE